MASAPFMDQEQGITFENVGFTYAAPGGGVRALREVSMKVRPGEILAVTGPNGSGKSTLALLANGLIMPTEGRVTVGGADTKDPTTHDHVRAAVGIVFQNPDNQIVGTVVEEDVAFGPENLGVDRSEIRERVDRALEIVGLQGYERREPHLLSGGQKQRLAIAGVLALDPAFLVFDEPTAMLDARGRADVLDLMERLRAGGHGIVHITHDLAHVAHADRLLVLRSGTPAFTGLPVELFDRPGLPESLGLSLPPIIGLAMALRARGVSLPADAATPEAIVGALWD